MAQLLSGYVLDSVKDLLANNFDKNQLDGLLEKLSYFDIIGDFAAIDQTKITEPVLAVAYNIINRGIPSLAGWYLENAFATTFKKTQINTLPLNAYKSSFINNDKNFTQQLFEALHIIDPRIDAPSQAVDFLKNPPNPDTDPENNFYFSFVPTFIGAQFLQLIERYRDFPKIFAYQPNRAIYDSLKNEDFAKKPVDFALEIPYNVSQNGGIIVEIDGENHEYMTQSQYDYSRDQEILKLNWTPTLRIEKSAFTNIADKIKPLKDFTTQPYFDVVSKNYWTPLYKDAEGLNALQMALTPFGVARIQTALLHAILSGKLDLTQSQWNIAVIERDVPCANLAISELSQFINNLYTLSGQNKKLPEIKLIVYITDEFKTSQLHWNLNNLKLISEFDATQNYDFLIDCGVLLRSGLTVTDVTTAAKFKYIIRSIKSIASSREIVTTTPIKYAPLFEQATDGTLTVNNVLQNSLETILEKIFNKTALLEEQLEILNNTLQLKNTAAIISSGCGKTLAAQFGALLQPAISIVISPLQSAVYNQSENLSNIAIDINAIHLPDEGDNVYRLEDLSCGVCLINYISPESICTADFTTALDKLNNASIIAGYLIIDEAHCMSEFSHDYRNSFLGVSRVLKNYHSKIGNNSFTTLALMNEASFNTIFDVQNEWNIDAVIPFKTDRNHVTYQLTLVDGGDFGQNPQVESVYNTIGSKKQLAINTIVKNLFYSNPKADTTATNSVLIICPENEGVYGITDQKGNGMSDTLSKSFLALKTFTFLGTTNESPNKVNKDLAATSLNNLSKFAGGQAQILIGQADVGKAIDYPNLPLVIHHSMPPSIEDLVQSAARAGRDGNPAQVNVLYNNQIIETEKDVEWIDVNQLKAKKVQSITINTERDFALRKLNTKFKGLRNEQEAVNELLTSITFPVNHPRYELLKNLEHQFGVEVDIVSYPAFYPYQLQFNSDTKTYGYIDFRSNALTPHAEFSNFDKTLSGNILNFSVNFIATKCPSNQNQFDWLDLEIQTPAIKGITANLDEMQSGENRTIEVPFENNKLGLMTILLHTSASNKFDERTILNAIVETNSHLQFFENLAKIASINVVSENVNVPQAAETLYYQIRQKEDTLQAVSRFITVGAVDNIEIDYSRSSIRLTFTKKTDEDYLMSMLKYFEKFSTKTQVNKIVDNVLNFAGDTVMQKCVNYLLNFVYDTVVNSRLQSIDWIEKAFDKIVAIKDDSQTDQILRQYINDYYNSKYANADIAPNLVIDTNQFSISNIEIVRKYISLAFTNENLYHLRNSTAKLKPQPVANSTLNILNAFSSILIDPENVDELNTNLNNLASGLVSLRLSEPLSADDYSAAYNWILGKLYETNPDIKTNVEPHLEMKTNYSWLTTFNSKFLDKLVLQT